MGKITVAKARELAMALSEASEEVIYRGEEVHLEEFDAVVVALPPEMEAIDPLYIVVPDV